VLLQTERDKYKMKQKKWLSTSKQEGPVQNIVYVFGLISYILFPPCFLIKNFFVGPSVLMKIITFS
jgi:hypothetical protein